MGKGKKKTEQSIVGAGKTIKKEEAPAKNEGEMQKTIESINSMDLNDENFIDTKAFDQSKTILENAMDDLNHYLSLYNKGNYKAFNSQKTVA